MLSKIISLPNSYSIYNTCVRMTYRPPVIEFQTCVCVGVGGGYTIHDIVATQVKFQWFHCTDCFQSYIQYIQPYISISIVFLLKRLHFNCFCVSCGVQVAHASLILLTCIEVLQMHHEPCMAVCNAWDAYVVVANDSK